MIAARPTPRNFGNSTAPWPPAITRQHGILTSLVFFRPVGIELPLSTWLRSPPSWVRRAGEMWRRNPRGLVMLRNPRNPCWLWRMGAVPVRGPFAPLQWHRVSLRLRNPRDWLNRRHPSIRRVLPPVRPDRGAPPKERKFMGKPRREPPWEWNTRSWRRKTWI